MAQTLSILFLLLISAFFSLREQLFRSAKSYDAVAFDVTKLTVSTHLMPINNSQKSRSLNSNWLVSPSIILRRAAL